MQPQLPMPPTRRDPLNVVAVFQAYVRAIIYVAFWLLAAIVSLGVVVGVGIVFARGVLWFIRLSTLTLGV